MWSERMMSHLILLVDLLPRDQAQNLSELRCKKKTVFNINQKCSNARKLQETISDGSLTDAPIQVSFSLNHCFKVCFDAVEEIKSHDC